MCHAPLSDPPLHDFPPAFPCLDFVLFLPTDEDDEEDEISTPGTGSMGTSSPHSAGSLAASLESPTSPTWTQSKLLEVAGGCLVEENEHDEEDKAAEGVSSARKLGEETKEDNAAGVAALAKRLEFPPARVSWKVILCHLAKGNFPGCRMVGKATEYRELGSSSNLTLLS